MVQGLRKADDQELEADSRQRALENQLESTQVGTFGLFLALFHTHDKLRVKYLWNVGRVSLGFDMLFV